MLRLGVVGTSWITHQFIAAASAVHEYQLVSIFSRTAAHGAEFAARYEDAKIEIFTDWEKFCQNEALDVVYLASPNSVHFTQARDLLRAHKSVIVEKPAFTTVAEMTEIVALAQANGCFYFEAARHVHEPGMQALSSELYGKTILGANLTYAKYSSRYPKVLAGEVPNIFSPQFSGGALMDLGVYGIYAAVFLFGVPRASHYFATMLLTGVDGSGTIILDYDTFKVTIAIGKNFDSYLPCEIYTTEETFTIPSLTGFATISRTPRGQAATNLTLAALDNPMTEEARNFAQIMEAPDDAEQQALYRVLTQLSQHVNLILNQLRKSAGLVFAADLKESL